MTRLAYPTAAFESLSQAIELARAGEVLARRDLFANLLWNVQGSLQSLLLGDPDKRTVGWSTTADFEILLDDFVSSLNDTRSEMAAVSSGTTGVIDPATILSIINVVLQLLDAWRKRRQSSDSVSQAE